MSEEPLDIVIPLAPKDLDVFPYCISGLRKNLLHPIRDIHVIAPRDDEIIEIVRKLDCLFIDERELLPEGIEAYRPYFENSRLQRGSWMYQQFLKLRAGEALGFPRILVYDSDTVLINPFKYEDGGYWLLEYSDGYRSELDSLHQRLLPGIKLQPYSFMCHAMQMETDVVKRLLESIEATTGKDWKQGIMGALDFRKDICFSEYELYGCFALSEKVTRVKRVYWFNGSFHSSDILYLDRLVHAHKQQFRSLSFHSYRKQ